MATGPQGVNDFIGNITNIIPGSVDDAVASYIAGGIQNINETINNSLNRRGPMRGAYLEFEVPFERQSSGVQEAVEAVLPGTQFKMRLLVKEPIGHWFGWTPKYPEYGTFKGKGKNKGKRYTKQPGRRFASFQVLLKAETEILVPRAKASKQRAGGGDATTDEERVANFFIGVSSDVTVSEFIEMLKASKRKREIIGIITPSKRKHQWGGVMVHASD